MRKALVALVCALAIFCALIIPATLCAQSPTIAGTAKRLQAIPVDAENLDTNVPGEASSQLKQFKHELRDLIAAKLEEADQKETPEKLQETVLKDLAVAGIKLRPVVAGAAYSGPDPDDARFGFIESIKIVRPANHPDLLVAVTTLQIPCGNDSSLYILQRAANKWKLLIAQESNDYNQINGAPGSFDYSISPPDERGNWFLVTTQFAPWCTSAWHAIRLKVLRPGPSADQPTVLLDANQGAYMGEDDLSKLRMTSDGFRVTFFGNQTLDAGVLLRVHCLEYRVSGNRAVRVPPLAYQPQDFLDEWVNLPWGQAARWTEQSALEMAEKWHPIIGAAPGQRAASEFDFVQPCADSRPNTQWVIGLRFGGAKDLPSELFFRIHKDGDVYYVAGVYDRRPTGCFGKSEPVSGLGSATLPD